MPRNSNRTIKAFLILLVVCLSASAQPQTILGKVVGVIYGDTITVLDEQKRQRNIRLSGIVAPESNQDFGSALEAETFGFGLRGDGDHRQSKEGPLRPQLRTHARQGHSGRLGHQPGAGQSRHGVVLSPLRLRVEPRRRHSIRAGRSGRPVKAPGAKPPTTATGPIIGTATAKSITCRTARITRRSRSATAFRSRLRPKRRRLDTGRRGIVRSEHMTDEPNDKAGKPGLRSGNMNEQ